MTLTDRLFAKNFAWCAAYTFARKDDPDFSKPKYFDKENIAKKVSPLPIRTTFFFSHNFKQSFCNVRLILRQSSYLKTQSTAALEDMFYG